MISTYQLLCLLVLSRISAEIVYPAVGGYDMTSLAAAAAAEAVNFLLALPLLFYSVRGNSFYGAIKSKSSFFGWVIGIAAAFLLTFAAARTALFNAEFAQRTILAGMSGGVIAVLLAAFAVYAAAKGAEAIARSGVILLAGAALLTVIVVLAAIPHFRELQPAQATLTTDFFEQTYQRILHGGEYLVFAAMMPYLNRSKKLSPCCMLLIFGGISLIAVLLINLFEMAVLGEFYSLAEYPFTAAAQLSDIALFKRLDGFAAAIWSTAAAMRCGIMLFSAYAIIRTIIVHKKGATHEKTIGTAGTGTADAS